MTDDFVNYFVSALCGFVQKDLDRLYEQTQAPSRTRIRCDGHIPGVLTVERQQDAVAIGVLENPPTPKLETRVWLDPSDGDLVVRHPGGSAEEHFQVVEIRGGYKIKDSAGNEVYMEELAKRVYRPIYEAQGRAA